MIRGDLLVNEGQWTADLWIEGWALYPENGPFEVAGDPRERGVTGLDWMATLDANAWRQMKEIGEIYLKYCLKPRFAEKLLDFQVSYPDLEKTPPTFTLNADDNALVQVRISGDLPRDEEGELTLSWEDPDQTPLALTIKGQTSAKADSKVEVVRLESGTVNQPIYTVAEDGEVQVEQSSLSILGWIKAGFLHILPKGLDHILFILGLFLLQPKLKPLLAQTSSFTIAHSITLGMVVLGVFTVPSKVVESMIALSIAYVGIENLWVKELKPWRIFFIFGLGLLHGMGFASVMQELAIPQGSVLKPLLGFNIGVEVGQVTVLLLAFAATFWAFKKKGFETFRKVASGAIALMGLYWTVERLMG